MFKVTCIAVALTSAAACYGTEARFDDLHKSPSQFNRQKVTVRGVAEVTGDYIFLWRDVSGCKRHNYKQSIFVVQDLSKAPYPGTNLSPYSAANLHWAKVTGTVDTSYHGLFGNKPVGLLLEKIEVLPGPRLKQFLPILAWFRNDTERDVKMRVAIPPIETLFTIRAHEVDETAIERGRGKAIANTASGAAFASCALTPSGSERYYYRINQRGIQPVLPQEARHWRFAPTPERD